MTDKMLSEAEACTRCGLPVKPTSKVLVSSLFAATELNPKGAEAFHLCFDCTRDVMLILTQAKLAIPKPRQDAGRVEALEDEAQGMRFMAATLAEEIKRLNHINAMAWELGALEAVDIINHEDQEANWDRLNIAWQVNERLLKRLLADPAVDRTLAALTLEAKPQTDNGGLVEKEGK